MFMHSPASDFRWLNLYFAQARTMGVFHKAGFAKTQSMLTPSNGKFRVIPSRKRGNWNSESATRATDSVSWTCSLAGFVPETLSFYLSPPTRSTLPDVDWPFIFNLIDIVKQVNLKYLTSWESCPAQSGCPVIPKGICFWNAVAFHPIVCFILHQQPHAPQTCAHIKSDFAHSLPFLLKW